MAEAGQYAGVCRQTVSHWMNHDPAFRAVYDQWRQQTKAFTRARLEALGESAIEVITRAVREQCDQKIALYVLKGLGVLDTPR